MADSKDIKYGEVVALFGPDDGGYMLGDTVTRGVFLDSEEYSQCPVWSLQVKLRKQSVLPWTRTQCILR